MTNWENERWVEKGTFRGETARAIVDMQRERHKG